MQDTQTARRRYDELPYVARPYVDLHPDRLATEAALSGFAAPALEHASVLEIGCGVGVHLTLLAVEWPNAQFVGFDIAEVQIEAARDLARQLGVDNVRFEVMDLMELPRTYPTFDYILVHGLYSWVPTPVRDALMSVLRRHLAPTGVASVSLNTYPGWGPRRAMRDLMLLAARGSASPAETIKRGRRALQLLAQHSTRETPWHQTLNEHHAHLDELPDNYLFHDFLADVNQPVWLHEFIADCDAHSLSLLGPADVERLDVAEGRGFRHQCLVHSKRTPDSLKPRLDQLRIAGNLRVDGSDIVHDDGRLVSAGDAEVRSVLVQLSALRPLSLPMSQVLETSDSVRSAEALRARLIDLYRQGVVDLRLRPDRCVDYVSERPEVWSIARAFAAKGAFYTPNLRHEAVCLDEFHRVLVSLCDGAHTRQQLHAALAEVVTQTSDQALDQQLQHSLLKLSFDALLIA